MSEWLPIISLVVAILAVIFAFVRGGTVVTPQSVLTAVDSVRPLASELAAVATIVVQANEQRKRNGQLTNEQAYHDALNAVRGWVSGIDPRFKVSITNDQIIMAINSAVLVASSLTHAIEESKAVVAEAAPTYTMPVERTR